MGGPPGAVFLIADGIPDPGPESFQGAFAGFPLKIEVEFRLIGNRFPRSGADPVPSLHVLGIGGDPVQTDPGEIVGGFCQNRLFIGPVEIKKL